MKKIESDLQFLGWLDIKMIKLDILGYTKYYIKMHCLFKNVAVGKI